MRARNISLTVSAALALGLSVPAGAVTLTQLCGPTVCYEYDSDVSTLFGSPHLVGGTDILEFTPTSFDATSYGGGVDTTVALFNFTRVWTTVANKEIGTVSVVEEGDYQIVNGGSVSASLRLQSVDLTNDLGIPVGVNPGEFPESIVDLQGFTANTPTGFAFQNWSLAGAVNPSVAFIDLATNVNLQIQNTLEAVTGASGQSAYIAKKLTLIVGAVSPIENQIPVPAAAWLFGSSLGLLGWARRRASAG